MSAVTQYEDTPREVITKDRKDDINIKKGTDGHHFKTDIRISASIETKLEKGQWPSIHSKVNQIRLKERFKFKFQFMVFDLTKTETIDKSG